MHCRPKPSAMGNEPVDLSLDWAEGSSKSGIVFFISLKSYLLSKYVTYPKWSLTWGKIPISLCV